MFVVILLKIKTFTIYIFEHLFDSLKLHNLTTAHLQLKILTKDSHASCRPLWTSFVQSCIKDGSRLVCQICSTSDQSLCTIRLFFTEL